MVNSTGKECRNFCNDKTLWRFTRSIANLAIERSRWLPPPTDFTKINYDVMGLFFPKRTNLVSGCTWFGYQEQFWFSYCLMPQPRKLVPSQAYTCGCEKIEALHWQHLRRTLSFA
ncbi:hypothetical protein ACB092_04G075600 [Castanea dentata]